MNILRDSDEEVVDERVLMRAFRATLKQAWPEHSLRITCDMGRGERSDWDTMMDVEKADGCCVISGLYKPSEPIVCSST